MKLTAHDYIEGAHVRRADKMHRCTRCRGAIAAGDEHVQYLVLSSGYRFELRYCLLCADQCLRAGGVPAMRR